MFSVALFKDDNIFHRHLFFDIYNSSQVTYAVSDFHWYFWQKIFCQDHSKVSLLFPMVFCFVKVCAREYLTNFNNAGLTLLPNYNTFCFLYFLHMLFNFYFLENEITSSMKAAVCQVKANMASAVRGIKATRDLWARLNLLSKIKRK